MLCSVSVLSTDGWFVLEEGLLCSERFPMIHVKPFLPKV